MTIQTVELDGGIYDIFSMEYNVENNQWCVRVFYNERSGNTCKTFNGLAWGITIEAAIIAATKDCKEKIDEYNRQ